MCFKVPPERVECVRNRVQILGAAARSEQELKISLVWGLGAAASNEWELKIRSVWGTCKRLEEEDDLRTRGQYGIRRCER